MLVHDSGKKIKLYQPNKYKFISPEEFKLLIEQIDFEFVAWYDGLMQTNKLIKRKNPNTSFV
ncbi:hypothetical protein COV18_06705 [Candidatus Woesearchaeota archaeon CG10_big_fil_rev_8_21_14_0_10_37_12]|nr:MAG: hypothetical protein COV18_06705 [Candidatus Woesearchaeota archaeon CG10_big_fil_rev_8_21_14_0_10_37_12]